MKLDMSQITKSKILSVSRYMLPIILILQLFVLGVVLTLGSDNNHPTLERINDASSQSSVLYIEDVEEKDIDLSFNTSNFLSLNDSRLLSFNFKLPSNYINCQLHSRSPPV